MKWNAAITEETMIFESRGERWCRQLKRGLLVIFLGSLVAFLTLHPTGQRIVLTGQVVGQAIGQLAERQFVHFFGPDLLLRQRAARTSKKLKAELAQLHTSESASAHRLALLQGELPPLLQAQTTATQAIQVLTVHLQQVHAPTAAVIRTRALLENGQAVQPAELGAQVLAYSDLQEQVGRHQQEVRILQATLVQARALQAEAQQQLSALNTTLALFNALWQRREGTQTEQALTTGEQLALRTALQVEIDQAQALEQAHSALETALAALSLPAAQSTPNAPNRTASAPGE